MPNCGRRSNLLWTMIVPDRIQNILFVCRENAARSILAEALVSRWGAGRFRAFSAGCTPRQSIDPMTLETLRGRGLPTGGLRSKALSEFFGPAAPKMDFIVTVCDVPRDMIAPITGHDPVITRWLLEDPAAVPGPQADRRAAFEQVFNLLERGIQMMMARGNSQPGPDRLIQGLADIGDYLAARQTAEVI
jgi:arsenate reductase (thioredoxin)